MEAYVVMKKMLRLFAYGFSIACIAAVVYLCSVKLLQGDMVFELSYSNEASSAEYYALKNDNTLIWTYGFGRMDNFTYGMYFSMLDEQGFVKVSDEDAKEIKKSVKKVVRNYNQVPSNASVNVYDSSEIMLKHTNKYYNSRFLKEKYKDEDIDKYFSIYDMREEMKKYVKKYKKEGAYVYNECFFEEEN